MASSRLPSPSVSKSYRSFSWANIRFHMTKALRRTIRSVRTELRLFLLRPTTRRPWTIPLLITCALALVALFFNYIALPLFAPVLAFYNDKRHVETHFTHNNHRFALPRLQTFETVRARRCSWMYLEFDARDGRHADSFFENGDSILEEFLRGTQSAMKAFCAVIFEADPLLYDQLQTVRQNRAKRSKSFDIFTKFVPGSGPDYKAEMIKFKNVINGDIPDVEVPVTSIPIHDFILNVTFPFKESGEDVPQMVTAKGNGNKGTVVVRFNDLTPPKALWYLDLLNAKDPNGVLCSRIDRLVLDFETIQLNEDSLKGSVQNRQAIRDWIKIQTSPTNHLFTPSDSIEKVIQIINDINEKQTCRATIHVLDKSGKMILPKKLEQGQIMYTILAGEPTFNERVQAQSSTWMTAVPYNRVLITTNVYRSGADLRAANGYRVHTVRPYRPEIETHLGLMQSWSHLVRVRESWDSVMKDNPSIKWLFLVDDDTFVFPDGMNEYLSSFDSRKLLWGGSGEQVRIDNGDTNEFALWLRKVHVRNGGKHCYLKTENVPPDLRKEHTEYSLRKAFKGRKAARKASSMCEDTFCIRGCPAVPQGAAIFLSRPLVERLRPFIENCERDTAKLCKNCGSQRLYMCVNKYTEGARTLLTRGICRSTWRLEHREHWPFALTYHGFNRYRGLARSTSSIAGDMKQLWTLGLKQEEAVRKGLKASSYVYIQDIANMIACNSKGTFRQGVCKTDDGHVFKARETSIKLRKGGQAQNKQKRRAPK